VWPDAQTRHEIRGALEFARYWRVSHVFLLVYGGLLSVVQLCARLRWNNLLAPLGVRVPAGPLLAISSVGFMAILALPARLGELVRPALLRKRGISASAAARHRRRRAIVDGLLISLFVSARSSRCADRTPRAWMCRPHMRASSVRRGDDLSSCSDASPAGDGDVSA